MRYVKRKDRPLRLVVARRQDFKASDEYPEGYIAETLECGHVYLNNIAEKSDSHTVEAKRRRCIECGRADALLIARAKDATKD